MNKKIITLGILILALGRVFAGDLELMEKLSNKKLIHLKNNKLMLASNITVAEYMEFANYYITKFGENSYQAKLVKPSKEILKANASNNQAIVGINHMQATQYCNWLLEETNMKLKKYKEQNPSEVKARIYMIRLPNADELKELETIAMNEMTVKVGSAIGTDKKEVKYTVPQEKLSFRIVIEPKQ